MFTVQLVSTTGTVLKEWFCTSEAMVASLHAQWGHCSGFTVIKHKLTVAK